jgi:hypothetical protein
MSFAPMEDYGLVVALARAYRRGLTVGGRPRIVGPDPFPDLWLRHSQRAMFPTGEHRSMLKNRSDPLVGPDRGKGGKYLI